jgi:hypothetical protein
MVCGDYNIQEQWEEKPMFADNNCMDIWTYIKGDNATAAAGYTFDGRSNAYAGRSHVGQYRLDRMAMTQNTSPAQSSTSSSSSPPLPSLSPPSSLQHVQWLPIDIDIVANRAVSTGKPVGAAGYISDHFGLLATIQMTGGVGDNEKECIVQ